MGKSIIIKGLKGLNAIIGRSSGEVFIKESSSSPGFIDINGSIITGFGGKHYKYDVTNYTKGVITGIVGVDPNISWALYLTISNTGERKAFKSTQKEYDGFRVDLTDVKEIWINSTSAGLPLGFFVK